jgi:uncharacterized protein YciI
MERSLENRLRQIENHVDQLNKHVNKPILVVTCGGRVLNPAEPLSKEEWEKMVEEIMPQIEQNRRDWEKQQEKSNS